MVIVGERAVSHATDCTLTAAAVLAGALAAAAGAVALELAVDRRRARLELERPLHGTGEHVVPRAWPWTCSRCGWAWLELVELPAPERCAPRRTRGYVAQTWPWTAAGMTGWTDPAP